MQRDLRRFSDHLVSIGTGVAAFGIWGVLRIFMNIVIDRKRFLERLDVPLDNTLLQIVVYFIVFAACIFFLAVHLYIGLSACADGMGRRKSPVYLIVTGLFIISQCQMIVREILEFQTEFDNLMDGIVTIFIDITVLVTLAELMIAAIHVRLLTRQLAEQR